MTRLESSVRALEARARRAALAVGYIARKNRRAFHPLENLGEFMLVDREDGIPVAGFAYDMTAPEVIEWCKPD